MVEQIISILYFSWQEIKIFCLQFINQEQETQANYLKIGYSHQENWSKVVSINEEIKGKVTGRDSYFSFNTHLYFNSSYVCVYLPNDLFKNRSSEGNEKHPIKKVKWRKNFY